jgi:hypothetical protein
MKQLVLIRESKSTSRPLAYSSKNQMTAKLCFLLACVCMSAFLRPLCDWERERQCWWRAAAYYTHVITTKRLFLLILTALPAQRDNNKFELQTRLGVPSAFITIRVLKDNHKVVEWNSAFLPKRKPPRETERDSKAKRASQFASFHPASGEWVCACAFAFSTESQSK